MNFAARNLHCKCTVVTSAYCAYSSAGLLWHRTPAVQLAAQTRKLEQAEKKVKSSSEQAQGLKEQIQAQTAARQKGQDSFNKQLQVMLTEGWGGVA
jgi:hypothetical protein